MAATPENACIPQSVEPDSSPDKRPTARASADESYPGLESNAQMLAEFSQLRERFARTTNALASAAHDLKTPLAILNGYVEVLQSEKLGGLNPRQHEVLRRHALERAALAALHSGFPHLQRSRNRRTQVAL